VPAVVWVGVVVALTAWAVAARWHTLGAPLWIDEGISIGIASHPIGDIFGLLRQDGSPPVYYLLLHVWLAITSDSESSAHALSVIFAILGVPAVTWAAWRPFGPLAGLIAGALAAVNPFLGLYADEVRMYSLVFLLAALCTGAYLRAFFVDGGSRRWAIAFAVLGALLCLTHGWGFFFGAAAAVGLLVPLALGPDRRALVINAAIAFGIAVVLFAPWLPTQIFQAAHTAAPWSHPPKVNSFKHAMVSMLNGRTPERLLLAAGLIGLIVAVVRGPRDRRAAAVSLWILALGTIIIAFIASRIATPAWALRYLTVCLAPLLVALGATLAAAWPIGLVVTAVVCLGIWSGHPTAATLSRKSDVKDMAAALAPQLAPGTLVASTQPEQVPVLRYYLPAGMRYVSPLGLQRDAGVVDWRDAMDRLRASTVRGSLEPALRSVRPGQRVLLAEAMFGHPDSPWTLLVRDRTNQWSSYLLGDRRFRIVARFTPDHFSSRATVAGVVLQRR
jgi:hypothetical protein